MRDTNTLPSARNLLVAVAVLLGVLAMHAVAGGTHAADHPVPPAAAGGHVMSMADDVEQSVQRAAAPLGPLLDLPRPDLPVEPSAAMAAMCAAMLLSLAVVLGARLLRRFRRTSTQTSPPTPGLIRRRQATRAPPPDLLTRLCVLRT